MDIPYRGEELASTIKIWFFSFDQSVDEEANIRQFVGFGERALQDPKRSTLEEISDFRIFERQWLEEKRRFLRNGENTLRVFRTPVHESETCSDALVRGCNVTAILFLIRSSLSPLHGPN